MGRWILLLPLCLITRDHSPIPAVPAAAPENAIWIEPDYPELSTRTLHQAAHIAGLVGGAETPLAMLGRAPLIDGGAGAVESLASLAFLPDVAWSRLAVAPLVAHLGSQSPERLYQTDPLAFLELCLARYEREVLGYTCNFRKQERIRGKLLSPEETACSFREKPFSVYMNWLEGARPTQACKVLYVYGENDNKLKALPTLTLLGIKDREVDGAEAREFSRYTITQFGVYLGMHRTVTSMQNARARGKLHVKYVGVGTHPRIGTRPPRLAGMEPSESGVPCYIFVRKPYDPVEDDEGVNELTIFVDKEHGLQVGSILKDEKGELIAEYFFRDIVINPVFSPDQFTPAILTKKK